MNKTIFLFLIGLWAGGAVAHAAEPDGTHRQQRSYEMQTGQAGLPAHEVKEMEVTGNLPGTPPVPVSRLSGQEREKCLTCHDGIEEVSASHPKSFGCTVCHGGDGQALEAEAAHAPMIYDPDAGTGRRNPSSLKVAAKSCGQANCHGGHADASRNAVSRVNKSLMGTLAGMISGLRYDWAAQSETRARYGLRAVTDDDGQTPAEWGAVPRLEALPFFTPRDLKAAWQAGKSDPRARVSHSAADSLLRGRCAQCHIDSPPPAGQFRSQGCAACHFTYAENGRYQGGDPTLSKDEAGHPAFHKITAVAPSRLCTTCHRGQAPESAKASLLPVKGEVPAFPGKGRAVQDVHLARGFDCVDCHTQEEIMGDGNIYSRQHEAVEVTCETCHGDGKNSPALEPITDPEDRAIRLSRHYAGGPNAVGDKMVLTQRNRKMTNVKSQKGKIVTFGKLSGKAFPTPVIKKGFAAHRFGPHRGKLSCAACHAQWAPKCEGCHTAFVDTASAGGNPWSPDRFQMELEEPVLMVGPDGQATPMLPQPRRTLTVMDGADKPVAAIGREGDALGRYRDWEFTNPHGYSGSNLATAVSPHSTGKARTCSSCHLNPRALGVGAGELVIGDHPKGREDRFEPLVQTDRVKKKSDYSSEAVVTLRGERLAGSHQEGARPFNQKQISRILKVGNCIPCHDRYNDKIYWNLGKSYAFEKKIEHRKLRDKILKGQRTDE